MSDQAFSGEPELHHRVFQLLEQFLLMLELREEILCKFCQTWQVSREIATVRRKIEIFLGWNECGMGSACSYWVSNWRERLSNCHLLV